jgi:addiction module RelE/StbE family toxin
MKVAYRRKALNDLRSIYAHIAKENASAAAKTLLTILKSIDLLADFPRLGRKGFRQGLRELIVPSTNYIVVYRIASNVIEIVAVFHGAQKR